MRRGGIVAAVGLLVLALPGPAASACRPDAERWLARWDSSVVAFARGSVAVRPAPDGPARLRLARTNGRGMPTAFHVLAARVGASCRAVAYRVRLPVRPNGATGWVAAREVTVERVRARILVDLSQRRLYLYRDGKLRLRAPVAIGSRAAPTPTGSFYVTDRLLPPPGGPFGARVLGLSAHSNVLTSWVAGGPVAIHGTNDARSIGRAVSHGCLRMHDAAIARVFRAALLGTPVTIRA